MAASDSCAQNSDVQLLTCDVPSFAVACGINKQYMKNVYIYIYILPSNNLMIMSDPNVHAFS